MNRHLSRKSNEEPLLSDPFDGFFDEDTSGSEQHDLMACHLAQRWMKEIRWGMKRGLYTYQQALDGCNGAHVTRLGHPLLMLSSYDYLGLIGNSRLEQAASDAVERFGTGTGGVRLLTGTSEIHRRLEKRLAEFLGAESCLTFTSGYAANISVISACLGPRDVAIVDELAHQSILDGCKIAGVRCRTFRHNDADELERILKEERNGNCRLIIVDGLYSMDGDICPLAEIVDLKRRYDAYLMVDEAHSFGVLGKTGRGATEHWNISIDDVDLLCGSMNKAIPSNGGFVAAHKEIIIFLSHSARGFVFSGALAPSAAAVSLAAIDLIEQEPERIDRLWQNGRQLYLGLQKLGYDIGDCESPLVPVITGSNESAYRLARDLLDQNIIATSVTYPAVKPGRARLRLCASAAHTTTDISTVLEAFARVRPA